MLIIAGVYYHRYNKGALGNWGRFAAFAPPAVPVRARC